jgi:hypothetical protein
VQIHALISVFYFISSHFFSYQARPKCCFANVIWYKKFKWLGISMVLFGNLFVVLESCCLFINHKKTCSLAGVTFYLTRNSVGYE